MEKTDAKIRLFLELSHQRPIQILNYIPLKKPEDWNPEKMYEHPKSQYYYAFINDNELISRMNDSLSQNVDQISNVVKIVDNIKRDLEDDKISIEFNGCNVDIYDDLEKNKQKIPQINENDRDNNMANQNNINNIDNAEEEKYVVFCKFYLKNFGFIHDFDKLSKEEVNKIYERPIVYALKGRIKTLLNLRRKDLELKKGDIDIGNILSNEEDRNRPGNEAQNKKDLNEDNNSPSNGIDGHWFLINSYENVEFLAFIKYKEKLSIIPDPDKVNNNNSVVSLNSSTMSNLNQASQNKYTNPHIFSYIIKDAKKFVTVYQNKSCKYHHNKNEFICKDCGDFCCLECFEEKGKYNHHSGHKISLLDEVLTKFEEDTKFLEERIQYLKGIIETEIGQAHLVDGYRRPPCAPCPAIGGDKRSPDALRFNGNVRRRDGGMRKRLKTGAGSSRQSCPGPLHHPHHHRMLNTTPGPNTVTAVEENLTLRRVATPSTATVQSVAPASPPSVITNGISVTGTFV